MKFKSSIRSFFIFLNFGLIMQLQSLFHLLKVYKVVVAIFNTHYKLLLMHLLRFRMIEGVEGRMGIFCTFKPKLLAI